MLPWGHAAVGYLAYRGLLAVRGRGDPTPAAALAVAAGTQFPDLVDKPLAWRLDVLPTGRSLAHSLLVAAVLYALATRLRAVRERPEVATGFAVGYLSHPLADAVEPVLAAGPDAASFLLWPLLPLHFDDEGYGVLEVFLSLQPTPGVLVGLALTAVAAVVWASDGAPGPGFAVRALSRRGGRGEPDP